MKMMIHAYVIRQMVPPPLSKNPLFRKKNIKTFRRRNKKSSKKRRRKWKCMWAKSVSERPMNGAAVGHRQTASFVSFCSQVEWPLTILEKENQPEEDQNKTAAQNET